MFSIQNIVELYIPWFTPLKATASRILLEERGILQAVKNFPQHFMEL
jgi:hypothetical protein